MKQHMTATEADTCRAKDRVRDSERESESRRGIKLPSTLLLLVSVLCVTFEIELLASTRRNETETQPQNFNRAKVQKTGKGSVREALSAKLKKKAQSLLKF